MKLDIATKLQLNAVVEVVTTADWLAQLVKKFKIKEWYCQSRDYQEI